MRMILAQIGDNKTIDFAVKEIARLIKTMDSLVVLDIRKYKNKDFSVKNALWIGLDESIKTSKEDGIFINVKNGAGIISGTNERSVLMAAYRFMYELGCRFLYPGADGEKIPKRTLDYSLINADVKETPDYNHRGICIEGGVSWEHVYNTIDWLPKVGMSAFFTQFFTPGTFFRMYYEKFYKDPNDRDFGNELSNDDIDAMVASLLDEVYKRGLTTDSLISGVTLGGFVAPNGANKGIVKEGDYYYYRDSSNANALFTKGSEVIMMQNFTIPFSAFVDANGNMLITNSDTISLKLIIEASIYNDFIETT